VGFARFQWLERPTIGVAAILELDPTGEHIRSAHVRVGAVTPAPIRQVEADALLEGPIASVEERIAKAAAQLIAAADIVDDLDGSAAYKSHLVGVLLRRSVHNALSNLVRT
jgi:CO/xanthine dehydrogenase FAD-binding subunit